jgi:hypothetical protein
MADSEKTRVDPNKPKAIPAGIYSSLFANTPAGAGILQELCACFYDVPCPVNADAALYQAGQRSVVLYILTRMRDGQK